MLSIIIPNHNEGNILEFAGQIEKVIPANQIIISRDRFGKGKGWAIREALLHAKGEFIGFIDGDGDIPPRMLNRLIPFLEDYDVVVGSKHMTSAPLQRKILTHLSRIFIRVVFGLKVDTQTGVKLFRREALRYWRTDGFAFDVEILADAHSRGCRMIDVPIEAEIKCPMSWRAIWKTFLDVLRIRFRS